MLFEGGKYNTKILLKLKRTIKVFSKIKMIDDLGQIVVCVC